jgi:hypothetical protein
MGVPGSNHWDRPRQRAVVVFLVEAKVEQGIIIDLLDRTGS